MPYPPELEQDYLSTNSIVFVNVTDRTGSGYLHRLGVRGYVSAGEVKITIDDHVQTMAVGVNRYIVHFDDDPTLANIFGLILVDAADFMSIWFKDNLKVEIRNVLGDNIRAKVLYALL